MNARGVALPLLLLVAACSGAPRPPETASSGEPQDLSRPLPLPLPDVVARVNSQEIRIHQILPLAKASSISFTTPFVVALLAWPILAEHMPPARLVAVCVAFAGVLIVIRPGTSVFQWASLLILGSSTCYALYQIFTRRVAGHDLPETSAAYSALGGTVLMSIAVPFFWSAIASWADALILFSLGIIGGIGHYCVARAMTYAQANLLAPFMYWQMVGAVVIGYMISGQLPDLATWIGTAIISGAGFYIAWRETRRSSPAPAAPA